MRRRVTPFILIINIIIIMRKLNVLLGITDHQAALYKAALQDYIQFFKSKQGAFKGERKTYTPKEGTMDDPSKRGFTGVVTTVQEKLDWFTQNNIPYIDAQFTVEATNASGLAKAPLIVDGVDFGTLTTLELMRLKSLLESELKNMYENIPVRTETELWVPTTDNTYEGREVFESEKGTGVAKTTEKTPYILEDPNVQHLRDTSKYIPQQGSKDVTRELGDYTFQKFSGEWTQRQKADVLLRRGKLITAIIAAIKVANETDTIQSDLTATMLFNYLHNGK